MSRPVVQTAGTPAKEELCLFRASPDSRLPSNVLAVERLTRVSMAASL